MGNSNSDGYLDNLFLIFTNVNSSNIGFSVFAYTSIEVEGWNAPMVDTLKNARLECEGEMLISSSCSLVSDSYAGEFVILKYKTKTRAIKEMKGILITKKDIPEYKYFCEKK